MFPKRFNYFLNNSIKFHTIWRKCSLYHRPLILGIETSCDDTGAAIMDSSGKVIGEAINSQQNTHLKYGGIIPPIAQDLHRQNIEKVISDCLTNAKLEIPDLDAIAVTNRPGLPMSLIIGVRYAKHLARKFNKPLIPIHHMEAHALTARMNNDIEYPFLCLLASGGHSLLVFVKNVSEFYLLGDSLDDSPGELFDKISRDLKLRNIPEYQWISGGAAIEKAARLAKNPNRFEFPLPIARQRDCQFSYSGLKNTARRIVWKMEEDNNVAPDGVIPHYEDLCAGLLRAVTKHICHRTQRAIEFCDLENLLPQEKEQTLVFSGGVACNDFIFESITQMANQLNYSVKRPMKKYCTDNGVMIAWNGVEKFKAGIDIYPPDKIDSIEVHKKCPFGQSLVDNVRNKALACKWVKIPLLREVVVN